MANAMQAMKQKPVSKVASWRKLVAMKKKSVSKIAEGRMAKALVLRGSRALTVGGLTAEDLMRNKIGKIVSKKLSDKAKRSPWVVAVKKARAALKITGFCPIKEGTPLYRKAKKYYKK